jgi:hypothetical protein
MTMPAGRPDAERPSANPVASQVEVLQRAFGATLERV